MLAAVQGQGFGSEVQATRFAVELHAKPSDIAKEWRDLESRGVGTIFQRFDWVDSYVAHVLPFEKAQPAIVLGRLDGVPAFILPLAVSTVAGVRVAGWIGGNHSGYNFGLWSPEAAVALSRMGRAEVEAILAGAFKGVDCAVLGRVPKVHDGMAQPLASLLSGPSPTEGYSFSLSGGFASVLERRDGSARRRKMKAKMRKMGEAGALRCGSLNELVQADAALDFFAEHKALRLAEQGHANSFAAPGVMDFFRELLDRSQNMEEPLLQMVELSVGGKTRAVAGSGIHRGRVNMYFMTFAKDEMACHSPGQVLLFRHVEEACERGLGAYDLGVGYEEYKTHWCDVVHELSEGYAAFTPLGSAAVAAIRIGQATKERMRRNEPLWRNLKSAQAYLSRFGSVRNG